MKTELEITAPNDWSAVTLKDYLELLADVETYKDDEDAYIAVLFYRLCGVTPEIMKSMDIKSFNDIKEHLIKLTKDTETKFHPIIKIGDKEYGFEPNLAEMEYGAYLDITKFGDLTINKDWAKVMNILYRPVERKNGSLYSIKKYNGDDNSHLFLDVNMEVHFGVQSFFFHISNHLLKDTLNYLEKEAKKLGVVVDIEQASLKSGTLTQP
jgi:hypothetical protein